MYVPSDARDDDGGFHVPSRDRPLHPYARPEVLGSNPAADDPTRPEHRTLDAHDVLSRRQRPAFAAQGRTRPPGRGRPAPRPSPRPRLPRERGSLRSTRSSLVPRPRRVDASIVVHSAPRLGPVRAPRDDRRRRANRRRARGGRRLRTPPTRTTRRTSSRRTRRTRRRRTRRTRRRLRGCARTPRRRLGVDASLILLARHLLRGFPSFPRNLGRARGRPRALRTSPPNAATWRR